MSRTALFCSVAFVAMLQASEVSARESGTRTEQVATVDQDVGRPCDVLVLTNQYTELLFTAITLERPPTVLGDSHELQPLTHEAKTGMASLPAEGTCDCRCSPRPGWRGPL